MRLKYAPLLFLVMALASCSNSDDTADVADTAPAANPADLIIHGGPILTMAGDNPEYVEAVAIDDGLIVYVGDESGLDEFRGSDTVEKDLGGRPMLPGFVDPHER